MINSILDLLSAIIDFIKIPIVTFAIIVIGITGLIATTFNRK